MAQYALQHHCATKKAFESVFLIDLSFLSGFNTSVQSYMLHPTSSTLLQRQFDTSVSSSAMTTEPRGVYYHEKSNHLIWKLLCVLFLCDHRIADDDGCKRITDMREQCKRYTVGLQDVEILGRSMQIQDKSFILWV